MKIFLTGAQGTGKSTLLKHLHTNYLEDMQVYDSMSARFLKDKNIQRDYASKDFADFQKKIFLYCLNLYVNEDNFISSRSILDSYAYIEHALENTDVYSSKSMLGSLQDIMLLYRDLTIKDSLYVYLPIEFKIDSSNKLRDTDSIYQRQIDEKLKDRIDSFKLYFGKDFHYLKVTGSIEERSKQIKEYIEKRKWEC